MLIHRPAVSPGRSPGRGNDASGRIERYEPVPVISRPRGADQFDQQQVGKHQESNRPPVEGDRRDGAAHEPDPAPDQKCDRGIHFRDFVCQVIELDAGLEPGLEYVPAG